MDHDEKIMDTEIQVPDAINIISDDTVINDESKAEDEKYSQDNQQNNNLDNTTILESEISEDEGPLSVEPKAHYQNPFEIDEPVSDPLSNEYKDDGEPKVSREISFDPEPEIKPVVQVPAEPSRIDTIIEADGSSNENTPLIKETSVLNEEKRRIESLDIFRGVIVALFLLGVNQGSTNDMYHAFQVRNWDGLSIGDLLASAFLFIVGFTTFLSLRKYENKRIKMIPRILFRILALVAIGLLINALSVNFKFNSLPIPNPYLFIALNYLVVTIIYLSSHPIVRKVVPVILMIAYLVPLYVVYVPSCGQGRITPGCNAVAYIDRKIFTARHINNPTDSYGFFGLLSAVSITVAGLEFAVIEGDKELTSRGKLLRWFIISIAFGILGGFVTFGIEVIRPIWSLSFVLVSISIVGASFSLLYALNLLKDFSPVLKSFMVYFDAMFLWLGKNPFIITVLVIIIKILFTVIITFHDGEEKISLWDWIFNNVFLTWINDPSFASLVMSVLLSSLYVLVSFLLSRSNLLIRV